MNPSIEIYAVAHKPVELPPLPDYCKKMQVRAELNGQWPGWFHDNDNPDNMSADNEDYSELTALYYMWKHCKADIQGMCHYRRYLSRFETPMKLGIVMPVPNLKKNLISEQKIIDALKDHDVIVSFPCAPYPLTVFEDILRYVYLQDIKTMNDVIREYYPDYYESLEYIYSLKHISYCNIFIARRDFVPEYSEWLFDVFEKTDRILKSREKKFRGIYGYLSEILQNVYIHRHNLKCKYVQLIDPVGLSPAEYYARNVLRKIPGLSSLYDMLSPKRKIVKLRCERRYEDMKKFIAGEKPQSAGKITDASGLREYLASKVPVTTEVHEDHGLVYGFADITGDVQRYRGIIAAFLMKKGDDIHSFLEKMKAVITSRQTEYGDVFIPEVICDGEISDEARKALAEEGATIITA